MRKAIWYLTPAALLASALLLGACGGNQSAVSTSTPSSTMGTDSAATQAGGTSPDTSQLASPRGTTPPGSSQLK